MYTKYILQDCFFEVKERFSRRALVDSFFYRSLDMRDLCQCTNRDRGT